MRESQENGKTAAQIETGEKVYVSAVELLPGITTGNEVKIKVSGNLPNPAYKIAKIDVQVKGTNIEITPIASFDKDVIAIQMLVPFEETVTVKLDKKGPHTVKLNGRGDTVTKNVVIEQ